MAVATTVANGGYLSAAGGGLYGTTATADVSVYRGGTTGTLTFSGGNNPESSATLRLYGNGHASQAADIEAYSASERVVFYDQSASTWFFRNIVQLGQSGTTGIVQINGPVATAGAQTMTMTNGPAGSAGNPAVFFKFVLNGGTYIVPAWNFS